MKLFWTYFAKFDLYKFQQGFQLNIIHLGCWTGHGLLQGQYPEGQVRLQMVRQIDFGYF